MALDVTIGQYYGTGSVIHRLDPRAKLLFVLTFIVSIFVAKDVYAFAFLALVVIASVLISRVPIRLVLKGLKPLVIIILFTSVLNIFLTRGEELLFTKEIIKDFWTVNIYKEGLINAALLALRIIILLMGTSVYFSYATTPIELTDGLERGLAPLKKIKVPVHEFAMMMTIALRFIPTLIDETIKIMNAQKARGADFSTGGLIKRAKALIPIIIPLFVSSFRRAEELATAMECRCYHGGNGRTRMNVLKMKIRDYVFIFLSLTMLAGVILINIYANGYKLL
ncbi:MAG: energy-coupling factor transporter transmembrane protein EcfT [Clostridia bacterium]|nr:energy-coupling factor transporter transmembrane protein EcfT [Clostridia bacterium]MBQ8567073.1 energy-coupling factor transporter transmembrane protein EcfT [Clostridia bacterium]